MAYPIETRMCVLTKVNDVGDCLQSQSVVERNSYTRVAVTGLLGNYPLSKCGMGRSATERDRQI